MPLYPYRCTQCGHKFEKIQSFSAKPEKVCPKCGGKLERQLTAPGLQFKGAGWYVNDYASKSSSSSSETSAGSGDSKSGSGTGDSASSGTKTETKKTETASAGGGNGASPAAASTN